MQFRHCVATVALLAGVSWARAQQPVAGDTQPAAAETQPTASAPDSVANDIPALLREYTEHEQAYRDAAREAGVKTDPRQHPAREYLPRFKDLAEKYAGQTAALPALTWILEQASRPTISDTKTEVRWVVERLTRDHAGQPEIAAALTGVSRTAWYLEPEPVHALYDAVLAQNQDHAVLAQATYQKAVFMAQCSEKMDDPKPVRQQALQLLRAVKKIYKDTEFAKRADAWIFDLQNLQVGMKAPEIIGVDADGKAIKLSDYRGHVVVIDFWASWDRSGRDALLRERDLMSMFGDQPFVVLGINCDRTREELKRFVRANQINFPCIYDGPYGGAIAKEWNVQGRTARFILDHHGIIRYRHVNDAQLEEAVRELMKKAQATKDKKVKKT